MVRTDEACHLEVKGEDLHLNIDDLLPPCIGVEETVVERPTKSDRNNMNNITGHISLYGINSDSSDTNSNTYSTSNDSSSSCCSSNDSSNSNGSCCNNDISSNESSITQNNNSTLKNNTTNLIQERCSISSINSIRHVDSSSGLEDSNSSPDDSRCMPKIRMVVLGAHGVGKSATVVRFLTQRFIGEYRSAVDIVYRRALRHGKRHQVLEIVDISTPPRGSFLPTTPSLLTADCVLVMYSVADHSSLETATEILAAIVSNSDPRWRPPVTLLGNKLDLADFRQVSRGEGEATAGKYNCAFSEVSAAESSEDIVPVFLHLIHRVNANASIIDCHRNSSDCSSLSNPLSDICTTSSSPVCKRNEAKATAQDNSKHLCPSSPSTSRTSFGRQNSLLQCGERIRSRFERNSSKNEAASHSKDSFCSQRCRSFDEALDLCQMEVFESSALDPLKSCKLDSKFKNRSTNSKKINKPQIPTGRSKNKKPRIKSPPKSPEMRLSRNDDIMFPPAKKCFSEQELSQNEIGNENGKNNISESLSNKLNIRDYLSRSVDHNLQKINNQTAKENRSQKSPVEGKPLTVLQRGRSFIQEAKDKHWKDRDLRLSIRNLSSRNSEYSKSEKSGSSLKGLISVSPSSADRPRTLPTGGKTWLSRSEGDDERLGLLDVIRMTRASSVSDRIGNSSPTSDFSVLRCESPNEDTSSIQSPSPPPQAIRGAMLFVGDDRASSSMHPENKGDRHRKFSVISRTLGSFLSRSSMPDLNRATANLYDRFVKKPIQKRSA